MHNIESVPLVSIYLELVSVSRHIHPPQSGKPIRSLRERAVKTIIMKTCVYVHQGYISRDEGWNGKGMRWKVSLAQV